MNPYNPNEIEPKWQKYWAENPNLNKADDDSGKPKKYILDMFPYPSGDGLHVGHVESYTATDIMSRYYRYNGFNVLHPQGWDAFGLPAENYAIKTGAHPDETTHKNIANFTRQIKSLGLSYDWSREIDTSSPEYYKWTQWFFLFLYKNGLAYKKKAKVNWCPKCQTVLANEQAEGGICERCKTEVTQKDLEQWFFKITDFIEKNKNTSGLIDGLEKINWPDSIKAAQRNWIGKSEGVEFSFVINDSEEKISVFTTRLDTVFGVTYVVIAPEHELIQKLKGRIENWDEVEKYLIEAQNKTELERMETKDKTGVELKGIKVINPFNGEEVPLFAADYVLAHYGTGVVMAVPAHDERDFEFAKKYKLPIRISINSEVGKYLVVEKSLDGDVENTLSQFGECKVEEISEGWGKFFRVSVGATKEEEFLDYLKNNLSTESPDGGAWYADSMGSTNKIVFNGKMIDVSLPGSLEEFRNYGRSKCVPEEQLDIDYKCFTDDGILVNSGEFSGLTSEEARQKMTAWAEKEDVGKRVVNYKLRDWLVSRQRYWGAPIPIIYCEKCGEVPVPESELPVVLPTDVDFKPTGESPLAYSKTFHDVRCPQCGGAARRESDTMDTFVCSSWYYLRYADPKNDQEFAAKEKIQRWLPVDLYVGGAEHAVLHLLYARFFAKVLHNLGYVDFDEPFLQLRNQGMILAEDGRKMSKSLGNVINPDQVVEEFGADTLRLFEMFMGPLEDAKAWQTQGIIGLKRFLEKVYKLQSKINESEVVNKKLNSLIHKTIKKVTEDIEGFRFNTAISALMILANEMEKQDQLPSTSYRSFVILLSPFAPHIAEELWSGLGNEGSIFLQSWPKYDSELIKDKTVTIAVQINGKVRGTVEIDPEASEDEARGLALGNEKVKGWLGDNEIRKFVYVPGKIINIVI